MTLATLREHALIFQGQYDTYMDDYGIGLDDTVRGLSAAYAAAGLITEGQALALRAELDAELEAERQRANAAYAKREAERRAKMTPEQRELDERVSLGVQMGVESLAAIAAAPTMWP